MNPSTSGWIDKYIFILGKSKAHFYFSDDSDFYEFIRNTGFIYGFSVKTPVELNNQHFKLTEEELTKVNLVHALMYINFKHFPENTFDAAINHIQEFYFELTEKPTKFSFRTTFKSSAAKKLEEYIKKRIEKGKNVDNQIFSKFISQALLFMDVLVYEAFILKNKVPKQSANQLEIGVILTCLFALQAKKEKTKYDNLLIGMFEASIQYSSIKSTSKKKTWPVDLTDFSTLLEKKYLLDLCTFAVWNDLKFELSEVEFLENLCISLQLETTEANNSIKCLSDFAAINANTIKLFQYVHPVKQFYKESTSLVQVVLLRNKKRLSNEISQSRELVRLLGKSTHSTLDPREKLLVKNQLIDIFKTIPSLTIFLLPGGALLLPLAIKLIPKLLPSAFNDNKIPEN